MNADERLSWSQWLLLLLLAGVHFTNLLDFVIMMPLGPMLQKEWQLTAHEFGALVGAYGYAACVAGLLSTWFIDRLDRRWALIGLYAGFLLSTFACGAASGFATMLLARAAVGFFGGILAGAVMSILGDIIPYSRRGFATGVVMSAFSLASILGIPLGLAAAEHWGWRWPFLGLALFGVLLLVMCWLRLPNLRAHQSLATAEAAPWHAMRDLLGSRNVRWGLIVASLVVLTSFIFVPYLPIYLVANVGVRQEELKWIYVCGGFATLATMTGVGRLADRLGKKRLFALAAGLTVVPLLGLTHLHHVPLYAVLLLTTLFMVISSARMVPLMALVTACTAAERRGSFMSLLGAVQHLAMALAASLGGVILGVQHAPELGRTTVEPLEGFTVVGWLAAGTALVSAWMVRHVQTVEEVGVEVPLSSTHGNDTAGDEANGLALAVATEPMLPPS